MQSLQIQNTAKTFYKWLNDEKSKLAFRRLSKTFTMQFIFSATWLNDAVIYTRE